MNKLNRLFLGLLAIVFTTSIVSCNEDDDYDGISTLANVMVVNATPGSTGYDFYIDDALQNSNPIVYSSSTPYIQTATGMKNLRLNVTNTAVNLIDKDEDLELNGNYTFITMDSIGSIEAILLTDNLDEPVLGKSHLRVIHASHNSPAVDIVNLSDTSVVFSNVGFRETTSFSSLNAGSYALGYRLLGDSNITSLSTPINLTNQGIFSIVLSGYNADTSGTAVSSLNIQVIDNVQ